MLLYIIYYACLTFCFAIYRSKDNVVYLWDVPISRQSTAIIKPVHTVTYMRKEESGDMTSLDWNHDGSLLAIGCYDSMLRVCTLSGEIVFAAVRHEVSFVLDHGLFHAEQLSA